MKKAMTIGLAMMGGLLLGKLLSVENPEATAAIQDRARAEKSVRETEATLGKTRARLANVERQFVRVWRDLDTILEDYVAATNVIERERARARLDELRWTMQVVDARITAANARVVRVTGWELVRNPEVAQ